MAVWKRSLFYLRRHKFRNFILLLILIIVASGMMIGITVWQGSRNGMKELQKTYGNSFKIKAIIPQNAEDERLWEQVGKVQGYPQYRYKGSLVNDELIERIMKVDGVTEYCKEAHLSLAYFPEIDLIDGLHAAEVKLEKETGEVADPSGIYQPLVGERENRVNGCSSSELLNYFRSNALEIIDGRPIRENDKHQILISDELAERNHLAVGDQILVTQLFYPTLDKIRVTDETEMPVSAEEYMTITGLFHVNVSQYINEMTVEAVNIEVKKGEKVAFIGENGSGKSTLIKMLLRFETPTKGKICIDGEDIQNYCLQQYRNLFAVVSQDVYLFHDTIRNNILMDREISDEELDRICRIWNLEEFIQESPEGYGRILEKNGGNISGGERQKMALLRAVIKDAEILILDEATANIDKEYDRFLQKRLLDDSEEKTVIVITHK